MYDAIVIGGGPAGLTAAIYLGRANRKTVVLEPVPAGGQAGVINDIVNYPGFVSVSGYELIGNMMKQAKAFGCEIVYSGAKSVDATAKTVTLSDGKVLEARAIIVATGCKAKSLGLSGEEELLGSGVSYCATCDGGFFKGKTVAVAGFGDKAREAALYLKNIAGKVYYIVRGGDKVEGAENMDATVTALIGNPLHAIETMSANGEKKTLGVSCVFISAGYTPVTYMIAGQVKTDERGYVYTDENMMTSAPGVFAAGDIRVKNLRQIVTAASDGAIAAQAALKYINRI